MLVHRFSSPVIPSRVVLLGAGGFLAPVLRRHLEATGILVSTFGSREIDLTSPDAAKQLAKVVQPGDSIVMAAALTPDKGRDIATLSRNLRMCENVCEALGQTSPAHFIYVSSDGVYDAKFSSLLSEDSTCEPTDLYTLMHIARERMIEHACRSRQVPLGVVRPCAIYGPGDTHNSYGPNRYVRTALKDARISLFGEGEERRHHVYVDDVAEIIRLCILHQSTGTINAITGEALSFFQIAEMIAAEAGREVKIECSPRASTVTHRHFDVTALARAFPSFRATPLRKGLSATISAADEA